MLYHCSEAHKHKRHVASKDERFPAGEGQIDSTQLRATGYYRPNTVYDTIVI